MYAIPPGFDMTNNGLHAVPGTWVGDSPDGGTLSIEAGHLSLASASAGTPFNARFDGPVLPRSHYFDVEIVQMAADGSIGVGVTTPEDFLGGWRTKGMFVNSTGNVSNGSAGLAFGFVDQPKQGDDRAPDPYTTNSYRRYTSVASRP